MDAKLAIYGDHVKPPMANVWRYVRRTMPKATHRTLDTSLRKVLSDNIRALQERNPELDSSPTLGRKAEVGQQTALRAMNGSHATNIDTIHAIAKAFGVQGWQLLLPGFAGPPKQAAKSARRAADDVVRRLSEEFGRKPKSASRGGTRDAGRQ